MPLSSPLTDPTEENDMDVPEHPPEDDDIDDNDQEGTVHVMCAVISIDNSVKTARGVTSICGSNW